MDVNKLGVLCQTCGWKRRCERAMLTNTAVYHVNVDPSVKEFHGVIWPAELEDDTPYISTEALQQAMAYCKGWNDGRVNLKAEVLKLANQLGGG